jgi:hypothetical protein
MIIQKHLIFRSSEDFEKWQKDNAGKIDPSLFTAQPILLQSLRKNAIGGGTLSTYGYGIYVTFNQEIAGEDLN